MCNQMWGMARTDTVIRVLLTWESIHLSYTHEFNLVQHSFHSLNHVQATHQSTNPTVVLSFIGPVSPFSQFAIQSVHLPIYPSTNLILHPPRPPLFNQFISSQYSCPQISYCVQTLISSAICPAHQFIHPPSASAQSRNLITSLLILNQWIHSFPASFHSPIHSSNHLTLLPAPYLTDLLITHLPSLIHLSLLPPV